MQLERPWLKSWPKQFNPDTEVDKKPLYSLLIDSASKYPSKVCLHYQGRGLTYSQVDDRASRFASALISLGLQRGDRVAIFLPNIPQFVIAYYGILKAGGIIVTCSPLYKERELEYQLKDSAAKIVIAARDVVKGNDLYKSLEGCRERLDLEHVISTSVTDYLPSAKRALAGLAGVRNVARAGTLDFAALSRRSGPIAKPADVNPERDVALLQYTGGTTGIAKGAMLTHYNMYSNAIYTGMALPITDSDVALAVLPLYHIYGMTATMNAPLSAGAEIVLLPQFHVEEVMKTIQRKRVTSFCAVPAMYIALINNPKVKDFNLRSVRACISGGAALPVAVRKRFIELTGGNLVEGYGLSEASPVTHCNPVHDGVVKDGSIGLPFPETDAIIVDLDDPDKALKVGEVGEVAVRGPQVMKGYWNRPDETVMVLRKGWLLTGDIGKMDEEGYFFIVDRKKDMVNVGGLKVYPREVEEVLFEHPAVKEAAVVGMPDSFSGEVVRAFVVLKDPAAKVSEKDIIDFCAPKLSRYKVPKKVEFVPDLPKTLIGKVLRRKLREPTS
ncbi:MAG: long-chain fatty acid--CoA ligase [Nitrososphaerales archaeon]|nr:long-chain fatty acid--CoA ligase [Nitrososphaerales archaeon]